MTMVSSHTLDHAAHGLGKNRGYARVPHPGSNMTKKFNSRLIDRPSLVYTGMPLAYNMTTTQRSTAARPKAPAHVPESALMPWLLSSAMPVACGLRSRTSCKF